MRIGVFQFDHTVNTETSIRLNRHTNNDDEAFGDSLENIRYEKVRKCFQKRKSKKN